MSAFAHDSRELAELYHRVSDLQFEGGKRLIDRLGVKAGARVLDIGCGTGRLAHWISERVGSEGFVASIDPLEERIRVARSCGGTATFEVGQAEDLSAFGNASFDFVCMSSVFHWVDDKAQALAEVHRVLRPGGLLGVTTVPQELARAGTLGLALEPLLSRAPYAGRVDRSMLTFAKGRSTTELMSLVVENGLDLLELHVMQRARNHASATAFLDFIDASAFGTFLRPVPDDLRASLRSDLIASLDAQRGPEGVVMRGWGVLLVASRPKLSET